MPDTGISSKKRMLQHRDLAMIAYGLLLLSFVVPGLAAVDDENILQRKAALVAQKVHFRNLALLSIDPKTCKPRKQKELIISQIGQIKAGKLNHCPEYVKEKLKAIDDEIANVEKGVLVYAPVKLPVASAAPAERFTNPTVVPEYDEVIEEKFPTVSQPQNSEVDYTGLNEEQRSRIFQFHEKNRDQYVNYEDDDLFLKLSNAYMRNLPKLMAKPKVPEKAE